VLQDPRDRKTVGRWESAQNLNSRSLTVADHGIQAMPPRRVLLNELKITGPRLFLGQSSVRRCAPEIDESFTYVGACDGIEERKVCEKARENKIKIINNRVPNS